MVIDAPFSLYHLPTESDAYRPMPRYRSQAEDIMSQIVQLRTNIRALALACEQERSKKSQKGDDRGRPGQIRKTPSKALANEERRIQDLQSKIEQLKQRVRSLS